jgi:crossover junction endodeoxyribonuclease RusA
VSLSIEFEPPERCLTMNQRLHWAQKSKISRLWRDAACEWAEASFCRCHQMPLPPCLVTVHIPVKGNRRRDPHNYFPTVKPIVDGLVDAGLWPDDTPEWVRCIEPTLVVGAELVTVVLEPM